MKKPRVVFKRKKVDEFLIFVCWRLFAHFNLNEKGAILSNKVTHSFKGTTNTLFGYKFIDREYDLLKTTYRRLYRKKT